MQENIKDEFTRIAREYILKEFGDSLDILEEDTEECEDTFCFHYNSKKFIETRRFEDQFVGPGPLFILKRDKKVISYGSAQGGITARVHLINQLNKERLIRIYYKNYDIWDRKYNLIINELDDHWEEVLGIGEVIRDEIVSVLLKHKIYNSPLYDNHNSETYYYTKEQLEKALKQPPLVLEKPFCDKLEDLLVDLINTNMYLDWTLSEVK